MSQTSGNGAEDRASPRPRHLVVVAGTATGVGKTWVTAQVIEMLRRRGLSVSARKPVQSWSPDSPDPTDAQVLGAATGEAHHVVCPEPRSYPVAMAPPMAAAALDRPIPTLVALCAELDWPPEPVDIGFVETVGGTRSPLAADADSRDLVHALEPDLVVLVTDAALGVIDATRTAVDALAPLRPVVFLNRFDPTDDLHQRNHQWLSDRDGFDVVVSIDRLARLVFDATPLHQ